VGVIDRREFLMATGAAAWCAVAPGAGAADPRAADIVARIGGRGYPSVFQAWNRADNLTGEDRLTTAARHDLLFHGPGFFGLRWEGRHRGASARIAGETVKRGLAMRKALLAKNPRMVLLAEIRYRDAPKTFLPPDHAWWKRDGKGQVQVGWKEGGYLLLDFANPAYRRHVAAKARAVMATGAVDGVMLDWWRDDDDRLALIREVRKAVGDAALILVNANDRQTPRTASYVNGYFMECYRSKTAAHWRQIARTLSWAEKALRAPRINCLETWYHTSRNDLNLMRAATTLSLTHSDGYCLFSDPNPLPTGDHLHNWYPFWNRGLGRPRGAGRKQADGSFIRAFDKGTVVYNPMGNKPVRVSFEANRTSRATGRTARVHTVAPCDGDILLKR